MANDYPALESGETVVFETRKHWVNVLPVFAAALLLILLMLPVTFYLGLNGNLAGFLPAGTVVGLMALMLALLAIILLGAIWVYGQNRVVLTNLHLVQITQIGLFDRTVSQLSLAKIQDVSSSKHGMIPTILNYGDITIETAGEENNFVFKQVPFPNNLCEAIMKAHEALDRESGAMRKHEV